MGQQDAGPSRSTDTRPASRRPPVRSARESATPSAWRSPKRHLAANFNKPGQDIVEHYTFFICSDGDLMEGISHEAASFAGHFKLGKLIGFYDDNHITIDGKTELTFTDDTAKRFEGYGWQVLHIADVNDLDAIEGAIAEAKNDPDRPTLIITRSHIGYGSPRQDSEKAHGEALGKDNVVITKKNLGWPTLDTFYVPPESLAEWRKAKDRGARCHAEWTARWKTYADANPADAAELERRLAGRRPAELGRQTSDVHGGERHDRHPRRVRRRAQRHRRRAAGIGRRFGRSHAVEQHVGEGVAELHAGVTRLALHALRNSRARDGVDHERHGAARRRAAVRRHVSHLLRLHASVGAPRGAHGRACHLHLHARFDRTG